MRRVNFVADLVGDVGRPGIQAIVTRLRDQGVTTGEQMVDGCLDLLGPLEVAPESKAELTDLANEKGEYKWDTEEDLRVSSQRVSELLQLIVSLREYQYA